MALDWSRVSSVVNSAGIVGFIGQNGSGKSLCMVQSALPALDAGRIVLSTIRLVDWRNPRPCDDDECQSDLHDEDPEVNHLAAHPFYRPLRTWADVLAAENCDVLRDEITGIASSREAMSLPAPVANMLVQCRRRQIKLRWSAPEWARADSIIRETSQLCVVTSSFMKRQVPGSAWRQATLFKARVMDARDMSDDVTAKKSNDARSLTSRWAKIGNLDGRNAYDTMDSVMALPTIHGGRCITCSGRRSVPACSCG